VVDYYIPEQSFDATARDEYFKNSKVGTMDVLGATLEDTLYYNPLSAAGRFFEQQTGKGRRGQLLTKQEYQESEFFREGIEVNDDGITEGLAELLAESKDRREEINLTLSRSRGGMGLMAAQFGVGLAGSMLDPLNVAAGVFFPNVSIARAALMMQKYGKNGGRFVAGAIDGAAQATLIEPLILGQATLEQDTDYNLMDSFMNVTFGTVLGGGLHAGFGRISDTIEKSKSKREALAVATGQALSGQPIRAGELHAQAERQADIEIIQRANERIAARESELASTVERTVDPETGQILTQKIVDQPRRLYDLETGVPIDAKYKRKGNAIPSVLKATMPKGLLSFLRKSGNKIDPNSAGADDLKKRVPFFGGNIYKKGGLTVEQALTSAREEGFFPEAVPDAPDTLGINDLIDAVADEYEGGSPKLRAGDEGALVAFEKAQELRTLAEKYGIDPKGMTNEDFDGALREIEENLIKIDANTMDPYGDMEEVDALPVDDGGSITLEESEALMQEGRTKDYLLGEDADMKPKLAEQDAAGGDIEELELSRVAEENRLLELDIDTMRGTIRQDLLDDIESADELIQKAETGYDEVARAGAVCMNRNYRG
jgi:hypothetical protein